MIKTQIPSTIIFHLFSNNNGDAVCPQWRPSWTEEHQVNLNALLHMGATALQEDLEVLFAGRTGERLLSPRRDRVIRAAAFLCHPANGFMNTAHSKLPAVQYTWGFVNSCAPFHFYFYHQVPRPLPPPPHTITHTFITLSASDLFAFRLEGGRLSRTVQSEGPSPSYELRHQHVCLDSLHTL